MDLDQNGTTLLDMASQSVRIYWLLCLQDSLITRKLESPDERNLVYQTEHRDVKGTLTRVRERFIGEESYVHKRELLTVVVVKPLPQ